MNLVALLAERAAQFPERPALIDRFRGADRVVTYRDLLEQVGQGAGRLSSLGLKRGRTILVFQPVSIELYVILLAAFHAGIRVMLADPSAGRDFLAHCCRRLPPDAFFGPWKAHLLRWAVPGLRRIPLSIGSSGWFPGARSWLRSPASPVPLAEVPDDEPALITFTSGSTGVPKAAVRSHGFLLAQHRALSSALDYEEGEVDLITLPVFVLANLASGLTSVLAAADLRRPGSMDGETIRAQCVRHRVSRCAASPAFFEALLRNPLLPPLAKVFTGGAPVFPDLLSRLTKELPAAAVVAVFGSTEAEPMTHLDAAEYTAERLDRTRAGSGLCAGKPVAEIELRVIRNQWGQTLRPMSGETFDELELPRGQAGEVVVRGDHVLPGYLDGIGDEESKIHVAGRIWHRTGDAGWLDAGGFLWLLGRCSARLPAAGIERVDLPEGALDYPFAIESAIRIDHPGIRTAAVGWRDRRTLVAGGALPPGVRAEIENSAAKLGIPEVRILPAIPLDRRHHSKIDYPALFSLLDKQFPRSGA